mgnify:CR=1 FL=1
MAIGQIVGQQPAQSRVGPVATGQAYAQQIAGGMPFEQVVAPGLQFSPEAPMGLTQAQLDLMSAGEVPVMPVAPTIGEPVAPSIPTMPFAPVGTPMPTLPFIQRKFDMTEIGEPFEPDLDLFLRDIEERELADILEDIEVPSLFDVETPQVPVMPQAPIFEPQPVLPPQITPTQTLTNIGYDEADIEEILERQQTRPSRFFEPAPVMPTAPIPTPVVPTNLTGLPQMPYIPPVVTPSVLTQPRINVDDIVSPIGAGRITQRMPNLFNIV